jgi:hypothetical protein
MEEVVILKLPPTPGICLQGLMKPTTNLSQDSQYKSRDLNPGPSEYEAKEVTTLQRRSETDDVGPRGDWKRNSA